MGKKIKRSLNILQSEKKGKHSQEDLDQVFTGVLAISRRERKVIEILEKGAGRALLTLNNSVKTSPKQEEMLSPEGLNGLNKTTASLITLIQEFRKTLGLYKFLHDTEESLANEMDDEKLGIYRSLIENLNNSIIALIRRNKELTSSEQFLAQATSEIEEIRKVLEKKNLKECIGPSIISAAFRVFAANTAAALTMAGNPLENPEFWDLTVRIAASVVLINYLDYTFNMFTAMTVRTSKLLRIM